MSVMGIDAETGAAFLPKRQEQPDAEAGREWRRQLEAELAKRSVCKAIRLGELSSPPLGDEEAGPGARPDQGLQMEREVKSKASPPPEDGQANEQRGMMSRPSVGTQVGAKRTATIFASLAGRSKGEIETPAVSQARVLERVAEAALRSWLKPCKITVFASQDGLRVWVRDARLDATEADALGRRLARLLDDKGGRLAMLTVNGAVAFQQNPAAGKTILIRE